MALSEPPIDFVRDIRPILSQHCFACHGPDEEAREADVSFVTFEEATRAHEPGRAAVVPGDRANSVLWQRINDPNDPMPPKSHHKPLTLDQRALLGRWIDEGASYAPHWAYVQPTATELPEHAHNSWTATAIDTYLLDRFTKEGLEPSEATDPVTLLRRVSYDLTGLPPSIETIEAFLADASASAYEELVDQLLETPHFGERLATFWLDLVRYADTVGYHGDQEHNAWHYRDWVIAAFNDNKPFDRFTTQQLAGDLLPEPTQDDLIASGYNRLLQTTHEGGLQLKEYRAIYMADRVRNVSEVWMGATLGCAQCHDHKYDPYTMQDFYAFGAFFADIDDEEHLVNPYGGLNTTPTLRAPEMRVTSADSTQRYERLALEIERVTAAIAQEQARSEQQAGESEAIMLLTAEREALEAEQANITNNLPLALYTKALDVPRTVRILPRGNWLDETGAEVEPAVPAFLGSVTSDDRATRLDLAHWLTTPAREGGAGELTARVFVNRVWAMLFGAGLCPSVEDFGGQGVPPTHLALLDYLALQFVSSGWDIKALIREIVLSRAYCQSSHTTPVLELADPQNLLFARQARHRLPAEMVRDTALSVSGLLVDQQGGRSVKPPQPSGYYTHLNFPKRQYMPDMNAQQWRRGVYVHWQRQYLHPMLRAFDAPTREECTAQRAQSNTPLAALVLLNDPTFVEAARAFAERILREGFADDLEALQYAMRLATARVPTNQELEVLLSLLEENRIAYDQSEAEALALVSLGGAERDPMLDPRELAAWTQVTRAILNLHETMTRE